MSRSQFQSKRFILRHAWLNLWDERMTTGRINQVAILNTNARSTLKITPWTTKLQIKTAKVQNFAMFPHKSRTEYRNGHNRCDLKTHQPCWSQLERTPETPARKVTCRCQNSIQQHLPSKKPPLCAEHWPKTATPNFRSEAIRGTNITTQIDQKAISTHSEPINQHPATKPLRN